MNHFMRPALLALIAIVSVSLYGLDRAWSQPADTAAVIEGAKKEGELVIYGTTDLRQATTLAARALHPNAAKLFIDFVLSREGQRIVLASERNSARADLAQEQSAMKDVKLIPLDPSQGDNLEFYARQAHDIFGK